MLIEYLKACWLSSRSVVAVIWLQRVFRILLCFNAIRRMCWGFEYCCIGFSAIWWIGGFLHLSQIFIVTVSWEGWVLGCSYSIVTTATGVGWVFGILANQRGTVIGVNCILTNQRRLTFVLFLFLAHEKTLNKRELDRFLCLVNWYLSSFKRLLVQLR